MKKTIKIAHPEQKELVCDIIQGLDFDPLHEITIKPAKKERSISQNALYWKWLTILANEYGDSKEDRHFYYKGKFLVHIFMRDDESYLEMITAIKLVKKQGMTAEYESLKKQVIKMTSTTDCSVKQMTEYLTEIETHATSIGVGFVKDDEYKHALGVRNASKAEQRK